MDAPRSVGLRHEPVWRLIDEFGVEERLDTFLKVLQVYEHVKTLEFANQQKQQVG